MRGDILGSRHLSGCYFSIHIGLLRFYTDITNYSWGGAFLGTALLLRIPFMTDN